VKTLCSYKRIPPANKVAATSSNSTHINAKEKKKSVLECYEMLLKVLLISCEQIEEKFFFTTVRISPVLIFSSSKVFRTLACSADFSSIPYTGHIFVAHAHLIFSQRLLCFQNCSTNTHDVVPMFVPMRSTSFKIYVSVCNYARVLPHMCFCKYVCTSI
jgi:hypothetical protein